MFSLKRISTTIAEFRTMPRVSIDLMHRAAGDNDPFFGEIVRKYYADALRRHPRYLVVPQMVYGVAICELPATFDKYYMKIEASARRNHKKAIREGCSFRRIAFNDHLEAIGDIRKSTDTRQGRLMPAVYRSGVVQPCNDPPSTSPIHDYPYFGVFQEERLIGYVSCLIAGQMCSIEHILGHAEYLTLGAVPQLIIGIAQHLYEHRKQVCYYAYGTYFGAAETMQRFKRKFGFHPHRVDWMLDVGRSAPANESSALKREISAT
jgi:hypothetical protein